MEGSGDGEQLPPWKTSQRARFQGGVEVGGVGEIPPPSKMSKLASFRGWVEGGGPGGHRNRARWLVSQEVEGDGDGEQLPPSKTSQRARFRGWWKAVVDPARVDQDNEGEKTSLTRVDLNRRQRGGGRTSPARVVCN